MQNGHDMNFHILQPTDNGIRHANTTHQNIYFSQFFAETYHGQRVATSVL